MGQHYHFIGIGGIGMGTLATILQKKGFQISGSDLKLNDLTEHLQKNGAKIFNKHQASHVRGADYVVYSSAIHGDNPEMIEAHSLGLSILRRAELLAKLVNDEMGIAVAGAHGKTTTASMISHLLIQAGLKPTTAVGAIINSAQTYNANVGDGKYFVAEVDESDGTFLYFTPYFSVITNIDFEHVDYYQNWDNILDAYKKFIEHTKPSGHVIICGEDRYLQNLTAQSSVKVIRYGFSLSFDVYATNIKTQGYSTKFDCSTKFRSLGPVTLHIPGKHNVLNALACITVGLKLGIDFSMIQKSLKSFTGAKRRFQLKGEIDGVMIVDDYGHHPTEIKVTLEAARSFGKKRIITIFQPHRYSRTKFLLDEFVDVFKTCEYLILTDIYAASEKETAGVSTEQLFDKIHAQKSSPLFYLPKDKIIQHLLTVLKPDDLILFLGAGDIYHLSDELVQELSTISS